VLLPVRETEAAGAAEHRQLQAEEGAPVKALLHRVHRVLATRFATTFCCARQLKIWTTTWLG
jgi:hypothetical protein